MPRIFEPTQDGERGYVDQHYDRFAAAAWNGYQRFGRGVILVTVAPPDAPEKAGVMEYIADADAARVWPGRGWPEASTASAVRGYDPENAFLVMFLDYDAKSCRLHHFQNDRPLAEQAAPAS